MRNEKPVYRLDCNKNIYDKPWYVLVKCPGFWQQCSPNYAYKGNAIRKLKQLQEAADKEYE